MDNKTNDFEQQFIQNVKTDPPLNTSVSEKPNHTNLIIMVVLIIVMVFQSVFSIAALIKFYSLLNEASVIETEETYTPDQTTTYVTGEGGALEAASIECKSEEGFSYIFTIDNAFKEQNASQETIDSGTYSINQDIAFRLKGTTNEKTLYYGDYILTDGTTFYTCEEVPVEE